LGQTAGGLLQRVLFLNAWDKKRAGENSEPTTRKMKLPTWGEAGFLVAGEIARAITQDFIEGRFIGSEDAHRNLVRLKVAALIAVMHGTTTVDMQWWGIAGAIMEHSDSVKAGIRRSLKEADVKVQRSLGVKTAVREVARDSARENLKQRTRDRILAILQEEGGALTKAKIRQKMSKHQQGLYYESLAILAEEGLISVDRAYVTLKA
jgi:hypothetical protein